MKKFLLETLPAITKSRVFFWSLLAVVLLLMVAMFLHAWFGLAPTEGPDHTNPWSETRR